MKKLTISVLVASIFVGSLFASEKGMTNVDNVNCNPSYSSKKDKKLTPNEKALNYIKNKYGDQGDARTY